MNKTEIIFNLIHEFYGMRGWWISDLAEKLGVSQRDSNILTIAAGYSRGKRKRFVSLADFAANTDVIEVVERVPDLFYFKYKPTSTAEDVSSVDSPEHSNTYPPADMPVMLPSASSVRL